jgi:hypothetical protein
MHSGKSTMHDLSRRLERLETQLQGVWPADIEHAKQRSLARLKVRIGEACGTSEHPGVQSARTLLMGDTPEQAEADTAILQRWAREHPATLYPDDGARARIEAKLEEMARRPQSRKDDDEPDDAA